MKGFLRQLYNAAYKHLRIWQSCSNPVTCGRADLLCGSGQGLQCRKRRVQRQLRNRTGILGLVLSIVFSTCMRLTASICIASKSLSSRAGDASIIQAVHLRCICLLCCSSSLYYLLSRCKLPMSMLQENFRLYNHPCFRIATPGCHPIGIDSPSNYSQPQAAFSRVQRLSH